MFCRLLSLPFASPLIQRNNDYEAPIRRFSSVISYFFALKTHLHWGCLGFWWVDGVGFALWLIFYTNVLLNKNVDGWMYCLFGSISTQSSPCTFIYFVRNNKKASKVFSQNFWCFLYVRSSLTNQENKVLFILLFSR